MAELEAQVVLTPEKVEDYLDHLRKRGRPEGTVQTYRLGLEHLYGDLPSDKRAGPDTLRWWQGVLLKNGYSPSTVNTWLSVAGGFLEYLDYRLCRPPRQLIPDRDTRPELSRAEYLCLLQAARLLGREREYLYVKVFAQLGLQVQELNRLTVEAVQTGMIPPGEEREAVRLPDSLRGELLAYAGRKGVRSGPVFVTRAGKPVSRSNVSDRIRQLCREARVAPEKGNPRCLRKLCLETRASIQESLSLLAERTYDHLLENEQVTVGWRTEEGVSAL